MEYKIFGPGGIPDEETRDQLSNFFKLDESQRRTIADAFHKKEFDITGRAIPEVVAASSLLPEQFASAVALIRFLLFAWREYSLQVADIERDLLLLGCSEQDIETLTNFLKPLAEVRDSVWASNYSRIQQVDGLPSMDYANILCDARAVFAGFNDGTERASTSYKTLLGLTPMVIIEIISSDNYGHRERTALQMNEQQFDTFRRMINPAQEQLAILKERIEDSHSRT